MVRIKFTTLPRSPNVSPKFGSMALEEALKVFVEQRETSTEQLAESLGGRQMVTSTEASPSRETASDHESQSRDSEDSETGSDTSTRLKVAAAATLAGITYDFRQSTMTKTCLESLRHHDHYFCKGFGRVPSTESVPQPWADEAIMFEDFFTAMLSMPHIRFLWTSCISSECNYIN
jgi:hypothetical protein